MSKLHFRLDSQPTAVLYPQVEVSVSKRLVDVVVYLMAVPLLLRCACEWILVVLVVSSLSS
jgi:hypothetical protein